jgi:FkbM family methyltransferase
MNALTSITDLRAFQKEPASVVGRAISWSWAKLLGRKTVDASSEKYGFTMRLPVAKGGNGSRGFFLMRDYYEPFLEILDCLVKPGDVFFDCGANQGIFTFASASLVGDKGKVFSFEPQPYAVRCLEDNINLNKLENVTITEAAVSDQVGHVTLDVSQSNVAASIVNDFGGTKTLEVETIRLDDIAKQYGEMPNVIKLDVEGAEYMAMQGASEIMKEGKPVLVLEMWDTADPHSVQCFELLEGRGYCAHVIRENDLIPVNRPTSSEANVVFIHRDRLKDFSCIGAPMV